MNSHKNMEYTDIAFRRKIDNKCLTVRLYSHFTCILGDSGIGKTCFFDTIADNAITQEIEIKSEFPVVPTTAATLEAVLEVPERRVIFIDEANVFSQQGKMMSKINHSQHLFLCIGRSNVCNGDYPIQGIYNLALDQDGWFQISHVPDLNITATLKKDSRIITESASGRSESELLECFFENVVAANGRNNIQSILLHLASATVFADLGNIGRAYHLLYKRVKDHPNIVFYDYQCFEQLLYESPLIKQYHQEMEISVFDKMSIEKFYEYLLTKMTINLNGFVYKHGKPLDRGYLSASGENLFDSAVGQGILQAITDKTAKRDAEGDTSFYRGK